MPRPRTAPVALRTLLGIALALPLAAAACHAPSAGPPAITIRGETFRVEVARTPDERARGLGGRASLAPGTGMVFPFERADRHAFWMAGMYFDIDIVWIRDGKIVDVSERLPHPPPELDPRAAALPEYRPREPADLVLEVAAGTARARGWQPGDPVGLTGVGLPDRAPR